MKTSLAAALLLVCAAVVALFFAVGETAGGDLGLAAADQPYNRLVRGFRAGHLSLDQDVPPGLAALPDPYDPAADEPYRLLPYRLQDRSYYQGRIYLYFGPTPALVLLWPWAALTGHYLSQQAGVGIFCAIGFLAGAALFLALVRRLFPRTPPWMILAGTAAVGLAPLATGVLQDPAMYQLAVACAYAFCSLALLLLWPALQRAPKSAFWLAGASLALGLAIASRPSLIFGSAILLAPVLREFRTERRRAARLLLAAFLPLALVGAAVAAYNAARFGNPFEFGLRYILNPYPAYRGSGQFHLRFAPLNLYLYLLQPLRCSLEPAFFHSPPAPAGPFGYVSTLGDSFGLLFGLPVLCFVFAAWVHSDAGGSDWKGLRLVLGVLFAATLAPLALYFCANRRYELDFLPPLLLLALTGAAAAARRWKPAPAVFGLLLAGSAAISAGRARGSAAENRYVLALYLDRLNRLPEAIAAGESSARLDPGGTSPHIVLGYLLQKTPGRREDAMRQFREAVRLDPACFEAHYNLAVLQPATPQGTAEAIREYRLALQSNPGSIDARFNLGNTLRQVPGGLDEAIQEYRSAIRLEPDFAPAHLNLGIALFVRSGHRADGRPEVATALRLRPGWEPALRAQRFLLSDAP